MKSRRYVLNPEAVFLLEWSTERAFLPQGTVCKGAEERGQEGQEAGAGKGLASWAVWPLSAGQAVSEATRCLPQAHRGSHPQGTWVLFLPYHLVSHPSLSPLRDHQIPLARHWTQGENSFPLALSWVVGAKFFLTQS